MTCETVPLPSGGVAIVCGSSRRQRCACGGRATLLCDWKVPARKSRTCDAPICQTCATTPAPDKHLCRPHAAAFQDWAATRAERVQ